MKGSVLQPRWTTKLDLFYFYIQQYQLLPLIIHKGGFVTVAICKHKLFLCCTENRMIAWTNRER